MNPGGGVEHVDLFDSTRMSVLEHNYNNFFILHKQWTTELTWI